MSFIQGQMLNAVVNRAICNKSLSCAGHIVNSLFRTHGQHVCVKQLMVTQLESMWHYVN